jgi:hypothetical protein
LFIMVAESTEILRPMTHLMRAGLLGRHIAHGRVVRNGPTRSRLTRRGQLAGSSATTGRWPDVATTGNSLAPASTGSANTSVATNHQFPHSTAAGAFQPAAMQDGNPQR